MNPKVFYHPFLNVSLFSAMFPAKTNLLMSLPSSRRPPLSGTPNLGYPERVPSSWTQVTPQEFRHFWTHVPNFSGLSSLVIWMRQEGVSSTEALSQWTLEGDTLRISRRKFIKAPYIRNFNALNE